MQRQRSAPEKKTTLARPDLKDDRTLNALYSIFSVFTDPFSPSHGLHAGLPDPEVVARGLHPADVLVVAAAAHGVRHLRGARIEPQRRTRAEGGLQEGQTPREYW